MSRDDAYLRHIRDAIRAIDEYTCEGRDHFFRDKRTQDAVIRNLEINGEASKALSQDLRERTQELPWKRIAGMRDRLSTNISAWIWNSSGLPSNGNFLR